MSTVQAYTVAGVDDLTDPLIVSAVVNSGGNLILTTKGGDTIDAGPVVADPDLAAIGALTPANNDLIQRKSGVWTNRTMAQVLADLGTDINTIEGLTPANNDILQYKAGAWANRTPSQVGADIQTTLLKTSSTNRTSNTLSDEPTLSTTLDPNSTYDISFDCSYAGAVAMQFGFTAPSGVGGFHCAVFNLAGTGQGTYTYTWGATASAGIATPGLKLSGYLTTAASGGTFAFKWASATSGQTSTLGTSILRLRKISP